MTSHLDRQNSINSCHRFNESTPKSPIPITMLLLPWSFGGSADTNIKPRDRAEGRGGGGRELTLPPSWSNSLSVCLVGGLVLSTMLRHFHVSPSSSKAISPFTL